jgi:endonuclease/exonuclease/phosphatase family metal-dependent hydrolase
MVVPALLGALVLAACGGDEVAPGPMRVVAMSFNLRTCFGNDGINAWENRLPLVRKLIDDAAPDILGTQEAVYIQVDDLATGMPGYDHVGRPRTDSPLDEAGTIFYRTDRFERIADDSFQLSDTPDEIGSTFSASQSRPRIVTWVHLRERSSGREFVAFNTHFDTESVDDIQVRSAALTVTKMTEIRAGLPAFLSGDFNTTPGTQAWKVLTGESSWDGVTGDLVDPWAELNLAEQGTSSGYSDTATRRIDNVFHVPGVRALGARIVHLREGDVYASDHFQVVVEMEF